jgi:hypothetical protein
MCTYYYYYYYLDSKYYSVKLINCLNKMFPKKKLGTILPSLIFILLMLFELQK